MWNRIKCKFNSTKQYLEENEFGETNPKGSRMLVFLLSVEENGTSKKTFTAVQVL